METKTITTKEERKVFLIDVISRCISSFGDLIFYPVMLAIAATMENPAQAMLLVSLSESIPIFLGVFIGVFSDRLKNVFRSMHVLNILRFVLYFASGLLFFQNVPLAFYVTIIINFISDCIGKTYQPLANSLLVTYAEDNTMVEKQGTLNSIQGVVQIIAPLIGTILLATLNYGVIGIVNSLTFLATSVALLFAKKQFQKYSKEVEVQRINASHNTDTLGQIKKSFKFIFNNKTMAAVVLVCLVVNMFTIPLVRIVLPMFLLENQIVAADQVATQLVFMNVTFAVGNIIGSLVSRYLKKILMFRIFSLALSCMAVLVAIMAFFTDTIMLDVMFFLIGIVSGVINTLFMGYLMQMVTQDIMGGVTNAVMLISAGGGIIGDISATSLLSFLSSSTLVMGVGGILLIFGAGLVISTWKNKETVVTA